VSYWRSPRSQTGRRGGKVVDVTAGAGAPAGAPGAAAGAAAGGDDSVAVADGTARASGAGGGGTGRSVQTWVVAASYS